jgi:exodeoxyribonuclease-1
MAASFYFYDLETSGINSRNARIMQFGGQRTDLNLKTIDKPQNYFIKLSSDILPDPQAILVTGITPQRTLNQGLTEAQFLKVFYGMIVKPDTIFVGFNNVRFDDEFMRFLNYRNFYDAYEWQWKNGCSRWDLLDVTRMTRALRPQGIKWPVNSRGVKSNQLGLLTSINKLKHNDAHDALSDVLATIELARLLRDKQPRLFDYLLKMRKKAEVSHLVNENQPFLYSSGKYPNEFEKTTVVQKLVDNPSGQGVLAYDLRYDPEQFAQMKPEELATIWHHPLEDNEQILPIKTLQFNRCPALAPLSVLDKKTQKRLNLDMIIIEQNRFKLSELKDWPKNVLLALDILNKQQQMHLLEQPKSADTKLYDGFFSNKDRQTMGLIRRAKPQELTQLINKIDDQRLKELLPLYKARNFLSELNTQEKDAWLDYCGQKLLSPKDDQLDKYFEQIKTLRSEAKDTKREHILNELKDYGLTVKAKLV